MRPSTRSCWKDAFLNGDGEGKPTGLFADAQVGVTIGTVEIEADDVIDLIYKLKRPYRKKASFITNDSTLAVLRKLKDENGNYLWQPSLQNGEPDRILGYAIRTSQFAPKLAAGKAALAFGDLAFGKQTAVCFIGLRNVNRQSVQIFRLTVGIKKPRLALGVDEREPSHGKRDPIGERGAVCFPGL